MDAATAKPLRQMPPGSWPYVVEIDLLAIKQRAATVYLDRCWQSRRMHCFGTLRREIRRPEF